MFPTAQMYTVSETTGLIFLWRFQDFFYDKRIHDPKSIVMASQPAMIVNLLLLLLQFLAFERVYVSRTHKNMPQKSFISTFLFFEKILFFDLNTILHHTRGVGKSKMLESSWELYRCQNFILQQKFVETGHTFDCDTTILEAIKCLFLVMNGLLRSPKCDVCYWMSFMFF